jgi:hypothetical protein
LAGLFVVGCNGSSGLCKRAAVWEKDWTAKPEYAQALGEVFSFDDLGKPTRNTVVYRRLDYLEKYCWQTRIK